MVLGHALGATTIRAAFEIKGVEESLHSARSSSSSRGGDGGVDGVGGGWVKCKIPERPETNRKGRVLLRPKIAKSQYTSGL